MKARCKFGAALLTAALLALAAWYVRQMCALAHAVARIHPYQRGPTRRTSSGRAKKREGALLASIIQEV